jgi:hypothetical protein
MPRKKKKEKKKVMGKKGRNTKKKSKDEGGVEEWEKGRTGRWRREVEELMRFMFMSGRNMRTRPWESLYAFIPSKHYTTNKDKLMPTMRKKRASIAKKAWSLDQG